MHRRACELRLQERKIDFFWEKRSMNTFGGCGGVSCSVFMLDLQDVHLGSASGPEQDAQGGIVETGQTGNNGQPVQEAEVPAHYQDHLVRKRRELKLYSGTA